MGGSAHACLTMGILLVGGGVAGYIEAKSKPSLIAGLGLGTLFIISGVLVQQGDDFKVTHDVYQAHDHTKRVPIPLQPQSHGARLALELEPTVRLTYPHLGFHPHI